MSTVARDPVSTPDTAFPTFQLRFITAASIFDGHDAAINIIRRILQDQGAEVVHIGHNRSVDDIVRAALQEDVDGIAVSSYQGGHNEFFKFLVDSLQTQGAGYIRVFGGGGGTITAVEAAELEAYGVEKIYFPEDGRTLGLTGIVEDLLRRTRQLTKPTHPPLDVSATDHWAVGQWLSFIERGVVDRRNLLGMTAVPGPVIGITGTGGAGKSSVLDELLFHFLRVFPDLQIAVLAMDPTRQRSGGALLGDRIRLNTLDNARVYMRSLATRRPDQATSARLADCVDFLKAMDFGLIMIETAGTGQADISITEHVDLSLYVMTSDYGAPAQLEKIQMLDFADLIVLNKFDKRGAQDAFRDIKRQWRRNHNMFDLPDDEIPVYPTQAHRWRDVGMNALFKAVCERLPKVGWKRAPFSLPREDTTGTQRVVTGLIPSDRDHYLSEISRHGRAKRNEIDKEVRAATQAHSHYRSLEALGDPHLPAPLEDYGEDPLKDRGDRLLGKLRLCYRRALGALSGEALTSLRQWPQTVANLQAAQYTYTVRDTQLTGENDTETLSHLRVPKLAIPHYEDWGELLRFLLNENLPGHYPYTGGVFPYRRANEEPTRMFAGEGTPERTNRRFHYLARNQAAKRLSTAFDPITLYGEDADPRPDVYGRIGMSGVSVSNLDDVKKLYSGFDLCHANTSVSMTINGPAPVMLAWFLNAATDQQVEKYIRNTGQWPKAEERIAEVYRDKPRPHYHGPLPSHHYGLGLGLLGVTGDQLVPPETYERIRRDTLIIIRGTLQADILKEDQAQNECIFPLEFALRMMGDIQDYFIANHVRNYYSVSVSGYHIAEAGSNPVTQLAFTLANGFTLLEYYRARGMAIDDFAPHMSFFFSNGMDPEYAVIGRVARRIWARALRDVYHANSRSQRLKYHIQTSGRTLHAQTLGFNDIRTTLQALYAIYDNCNSLHTNAYDEALTTPTEESVRRALAIQLIINRELGLNFNQNPLQGSFIIEQLTNLVEDAVYQEFDRISERGGVLGAMETLYQRGKIQDESLHYERCKQDGSLPIVGINTFLPEQSPQEALSETSLTRSNDAEKHTQIDSVALFKRNHQAQSPKALSRLQKTVVDGKNTFAQLMETAKHCTLGQITHALYDVAGHYRRRI